MTSRLPVPTVHIQMLGARKVVFDDGFRKISCKVGWLADAVHRSCNTVAVALTDDYTGHKHRH